MEAVPKELAELDACASLYLREISEPRQNSLCLLIEEAEVMPEEVAIRLAGTEMGTGHLVRSTANSRLFEIVWDNYVAYSVTNESYATPWRIGGVLGAVCPFLFQVAFSRLRLACDVCVRGISGPAAALRNRFRLPCY